MEFRLLRLRFRRRLRKGQRQVEDLSAQAEEQIEEHLFKRFDRLLAVRRFVAGWLGLVLLLISVVVAQSLSLSSYYQTLQPVPGGVYNEGVQGRFTNANPIFATSDADLTVSRLIFSGLLKYDEQGKLTGDLASDYTVDGATYTVRLRPGLTWQDGKPLTSADVLFTYQTIQKPDVRSPLQTSWQGIEVTAPDDHTVVFKLPGILASFPYNLTNGIVPKHLLEDVPADGLRSADFNTVRPLGAGPFAWQAVEVKGSGDPRQAQQHIALEPFAGYQGGQPKLGKFVVQVYADHKQLIQAFQDKELTAVVGLSEVPKELVGRKGMIEYSLPLRAATMVFFKTSTGILADQPVRQSLVQAANVPNIAKQLGYPTHEVRSPLLIGQLGYDASLVQASHNLKAAQARLDATGWWVGKGGIRSKAGQQLRFTLTLADTRDHRLVARQLQQQWRALGVKVELQILDGTEFQNAVTYHNYDAILDGISIGSDPDVFVYWGSSQADVRSANRLNLSEYSNAIADNALEAGRTRLDPELRVIKYRPFMEAWQKDAPALGLYQPRLLYLTNGPVAGLSEQAINNPVDRLSNVHNWQIREAEVTN